MIKGSIIDIIDNSGIKKVLIINIKHTKNKIIKIGNIIKGSIKKHINPKKFNKGQLINVLIVTLANAIQRKNGTIIKYNKTLGIIIDNKNILSNKVKYIIPKEIKNIDIENINKIIKNYV